VTRDQLIGSTGPITITFNYRIDNVGESAAQMVLIAPETPDATALVRVAPDGLEIRGGQLQGKWTKQ
jgi:hypothetical protein